MALGLPSMAYSDGIRKYTQTTFAGYNHNLHAQDGELWDMKNLTSDYYPLLSPRRPRYLYTTLTTPNGFYAKDGLYWVDGTNDVHFAIPALERSIAATPTTANRTLVIRLEHSHIGFELSPVFRIVDSVLKNGVPLPKLGPISTKDGIASARILNQGKGIRLPQLCYTKGSGPLSQRLWLNTPAKCAGGTISAKIPEGVTQYYLTAFDEKDARAIGRTGAGVRGISIDEDDEVVGLVCVDPASEDMSSKTILAVSENGYGKRSVLEDYRKTNRGGKGVKTINITEKTGALIALKEVSEDDDLMIINRSGITIRLSVSAIRVAGRSTQGVRLINIREGDGIAAVCTVDNKDTDGIGAAEEKE